MVDSTVRVMTINGVELPEYPTCLKVDINYVSKSYETINAAFVDKLIAEKTKVYLEYEYISDDGFKTLFMDMIRGHILSTKNRNFVLTFYYAGAWRTGTYYLGAENSGTMIGFKNKGEGTGWSGEIHFIEVEGIALNDITNIES